MTTLQTTGFTLDDSFARAVPELSLAWQPASVADPSLIVLNHPLASLLGADPADLDSPAGAAFLVGNGRPTGVAPVAMAYAGHQFGGYSPRLGDGRAALLGEVVDIDGIRRDVHLKGTGRTPFARGGDGKAALGPMLREYLVAEAMAALDIPTTRALAVVGTGEQIPRETMVPGAVLVRVAASHLRVGTFEYAARLADPTVLERLVDYAIERHHPDAAQADRPALALLDAVIETQAFLVARWMLVGFIHGVMNTDNMTISGEGIDYGPCAFMDRYDPQTVFSSIDRAGRYAYGNQPAVAQWNLTRLAETLVSLIDDDREAGVAAASATLRTFPDRFRRHWMEGMAAKLGVSDLADGDGELFDDFLALLATEEADYTQSFRRLAETLRGDVEPMTDHFTDRPALDLWLERWRSRLDGEGRDPAEIADAMDRVNPMYIPRNHLVEEALAAVGEGDLGPFATLLDVVTNPYVARPGLERHAEPAAPSFSQGYQTFCGT